MAWYCVQFGLDAASSDGADASLFVEDYCHSFLAAGLRIPAAFEQSTQSARLFFLNPLASAFYFSAPRRTQRATRLLQEGIARPCLDTPDVSRCRPLACGG